MRTIDSQLHRYAKDFQVLLALHQDLEQRYDTLSASHRQLSGAGQILRNVSPGSQELCFVTDLNGKILQATDRARALFETDAKELTNLQFIVSMFHISKLKALLDSRHPGRHQTSAESVEILLNPSSDALQSQIYVASPLLPANEDQTTVCWIVRELGTREQSDIVSGRARPGRGGQRTAALIFDTAGVAMAANTGLLGLTGQGAGSIEALTLSMFHPADQLPNSHSGDVLHEILRFGQWQGEISAIGDSRLPYLQWMTVCAIKDDDGQTVAYAAQLVDREQMLRAERLFLDAHYHDPVTGLPNQKYFTEHAAHRIAAARRAGEHVTLLSIMLDRRQWVHAIHDTAISDAVIMKMAARLSELVRGCDILARVGEDRFHVLLAGPETDAELARIATHMIKAMSKPITIRNQVLQIGGSIGCALFPQDGAALPTLTMNAESAMVLASKAGGNRYGLFEHPPRLPDMHVAPIQPQGMDNVNQADITTINMELGS